MPKRLAPALLILPLLGAAPAAAQAQAQAPPGMLVPQEIRPGEIAPDPRITVPERIIPAPPGHGAEVPLPPAASGEAVVPHGGGGDPGILVPRPERKVDPPPGAPPGAGRPR